MILRDRLGICQWFHYEDHGQVERATELLDCHGGLDSMDKIAIHGFPAMWWPDEPCWDWYRDWKGWREKIASLRTPAADRPIWITETGLATWDLYGGSEGRLDLQSGLLSTAALAPAERVY